MKRLRATEKYHHASHEFLLFLSMLNRTRKQILIKLVRHDCVTMKIAQIYHLSLNVLHVSFFKHWCFQPTILFYQPFLSTRFFFHEDVTDVIRASNKFQRKLK